MQGFEEVTFGWKGEEYTIEPERQLMLVAKIEDALAGEGGEQAFTVLLRPQGPPMARLAMAFGAALRFGGAAVSDQDIYLSMMDDLSQDDADSVIAVQGAILSLLSVVSPPMARALMSLPEKKSPEKLTTAKD